MSQFLIVASSILMDCKELKLAQTAQINKLFQLLKLLCVHSDVFHGLTRTVMSKNLNRDVSKDLPNVWSEVSFVSRQTSQGFIQISDATKKYPNLHLV